MSIRQVIGILVILGAYGLTWFFMLKSLRIVKIIDREGLDHAGEIKARLKRRAGPAEPGPQTGHPAPAERGKSKEK